MGRNLVSVATGLQHAMTGNDDDKGVAENGLGDRAHRPGSPHVDRDFIIGEGLPTRNPLRNLVDALIENVNAAHVERHIGEVTHFSAQQRDNALDRAFRVRRRARFTGVGLKLKQPLAGFDLARLRKLHADNAGVTPRDAAPANGRVKYRVRPPRHTHPPQAS
jgi:hypothetical protein